MQQREHRKRQLQGQDHLAQGQQVVHAAVAAHPDDDDRRHDGQPARNQPPHPGGEPPVHEPFHHDLAGQSAGDRAALAAGQESHGEQDAGRGRAQQRRQRQVRDANPVGVLAERIDLAAGDRHAVLVIEDHGRQHQDGRVHEERDGRAPRSSRWC